MGAALWCYSGLDGWDWIGYLRVGWGIPQHLTVLVMWARKGEWGRRETAGAAFLSFAKLPCLAQRIGLLARIRVQQQRPRHRLWEGSRVSNWDCVVQEEKMGWTGGIAILLALSSGAAMLPQVSSILQITQSTCTLHFVEPQLVSKLIGMKSWFALILVQLLIVQNMFLFQSLTRYDSC